MSPLRFSYKYGQRTLGAASPLAVEDHHVTCLSQIENKSHDSRTELPQMEAATAKVATGLKASGLKLHVGIIWKPQ